jgi:beclin 1
MEESWTHLTASVAGGPKQEASRRRADVLCEHTTHLIIEEIRLLREIAENPSMPTYPLCEACTLRVMQDLISARDVAQEEYEMYEREYARLQSQKDSEDGSAETLEVQLQEADREEKELLEELRMLEQERTALRKDVAELQEQSTAIEQRHAAYWREYNDLHMQLRANESDSLKRKIETATQQV